MNMHRLLFLTLPILSTLAIGGGDGERVSAAELIPIRIGWQTTWATQGQITQTLRNTNVLEKNGLKGAFVGASYGAPLNEAALAGEVDVIFTADQPAAALLARSTAWVIIGRLMFNRVAIYVPPDSPIRTVADLRAKTIAMPFGAAAQRVAFKAIADAGLSPRKDMTLINLDITEQPAVIKRGNRASWDKVDAMAGFDPMVAILETSKSARILHVGTVTSVIMISRNYVRSHPDAPVQFLRAFQEAVFYYARHVKEANDWFLSASQLTFGHDVLALAASVEPNLEAKAIGDVNVTFTSKLIAGMQEAADFIFEQKLVQRRVQISDHIDQQYARKAYASLITGVYDPGSVYTSPPKR